MKKSLVLFFLAVILVSIFLQFRSANIPETDSLYHFTHSEIYRESGILQTNFPWARYSTINKYSSDIWYGFHLFLIPFTFFSNKILGLRVAGIFLTSIFLLLFWWSIARLIPKPKSFAWLWPFLLLFSSPYVLFRFSMLRPELLSSGFSALLFSFLLEGGAWGVLGTFFSAVAVSFFHISLFWLPLLILVVWAAAKLIFEKTFEAKKVLAVFGGLIIGWLLRPNPFGAAELAYIQIVQLALTRQQGVPLNFGLELYPLGWGSLVTLFWGLLILWSVAIVIFIRVNLTPKPPLPASPAGGLRKERGKEENNSSFLGVVSSERLALWTSAALSIIFFLITMFFAQRSFDLWAIFAVMFNALLYYFVIKSKKTFLIFVLIIFVATAAYSIYEEGIYLKTAGVDSHRFQKSAEWIKQNSKQGEIVFNTSWDQFPELFFWNQKNYYIGGMDPIFEYTYDPKLYWEEYYFEKGLATKATCASTHCEPKDQIDTYTALKNQFKVSYVFLDKHYDSELYDYLKTDNRFSLKTEDPASAVFQLK